MGYTSSTFLGSYTSSSKTVRIYNSAAQIVFTINACNYQKSSVNGPNLNIVLEDNTVEYVLDFPSNSDAIVAMSLFKTAIDTLRLNCNQSGGGTPPSVNPIPISYLQYKTLQQANNLIAFQWYDVTDTTGLLLPSGSTIRLQPISINDFHPLGEVLSASRPRISIDSETDDVIYYEKPDNRIILLNARPIDQTIDISCNNIIVKNKSSVIAITSTVIEVDSKSTVNITGCNNVKISNSSITLVNATNVTIDDIVQDFSTMGFNLSDVVINPYDTIGKLGRANVTTSKTLEAYFDTIEQVFSITSNNNTFTLTLDNKILSANAEFRVKYFTSNSSTGNVINVINTNNASIFKITDNQIGNWVIFRWNKLTSLYEFVSIEYGAGLSGIPYLVSSPTNGQTAFVLPIPAAAPTKMQLFINGQKMIYGQDFSYTSSTQTVTYTNYSFLIASSDIIEFIIF